MKIIPTTKLKQRAFLDALIDVVAKKQVTRAVLLRHLRLLRSQLRNRPQAKGRVTAALRKSPQLPIRIRRLKALHPEYSMQEIAQHLKISIGRVSEVLRGKRR